MRSFLPNLAESYEVSEDGHSVTVRLRPGIKWSDGVPLTSDDFVFTFDDLWMNPEFSPVTSNNVRGGKIFKIDDATFRYEFDRPYPLFVNLLAQLGNYFVDPKHFFEKFHPTYADRDVLDARIRERGYITWMAFINACRNERVEDGIHVPTLRAYRMTQFSPAHIRMERNPYYYKVDPAGRQLPYIDELDVQVIGSSEVVSAMAGTGQLDFASTQLRVQDIPLLKLAERTGLVTVNVWQRLHGSDVVIQPNYNHRRRSFESSFLGLPVSPGAFACHQSRGNERHRLFRPW